MILAPEVASFKGGRSFALTYGLQLKHSPQRRRLCQSACLQGRTHSVQFPCVADTQVWCPASVVVDQLDLDLRRIPAFMDQFDSFF